MKFRGNLLHLRQQRDMTQEQLAMLLGVSRQSVAKWEAGQSTPEVDKLVKMADLFGCTLDELVTGDLGSRETAPAEALPPDPAALEAPEAPASPPATPAPGAQDAYGYDEHVRSFSRSIALGVCAIVLGSAGTIFTSGVLELDDAVPGIVILTAVAVGLAFILPAAVEHAAFTRAHPLIEDFYTDAQKARVRRLLIRCLVGGISAILLGSCVVIGFSAAYMDDLGAAAMMVLVAAGVSLLVYGGMRYGFANVGNYNRERTGEQWERDNPRVGLICGIIMLGATALGLLLLFGGMAASDAGNSALARACAYFWVVWPIGGIACGMVSAGMRAAANK